MTGPCDDNPIHRVVLMEATPDEAARRCSQMAVAGLSAVKVADPVELLSAVRQLPVDLALLHLPVGETVGMDLPAVLRRVSTAGYLPVVVLADDPASCRCDLLNAGVDDVVNNAAGADELVARLGAHLRVKDLHDRLAAKQAELLDALRREHKLLARLRKDNEQLRELATTDPLTHLQNRRSFQSLLTHEFKVARRYNHQISLLMLDVDHFKVVNDVHGHPSGDYVLKELAVILKQAVRESDVVARTGGEEFSIILPRATRQQAAAFAERIRLHTADRQFVVYGQTIHVTVSLGAATYPADAEITSPDMLVYFADRALLIAKETGRDRVVAFSDLDRTLRRRLRRQHLQTQKDMQRREACDLTAIEVPNEP